MSKIFEDFFDKHEEEVFTANSTKNLLESVPLVKIEPSVQNSKNESDKEYLERFKGWINQEPLKIPSNPRTGWICPVCGAGVSPDTTVCPCKMKG